jgi:isoleucyl-tRNA synthetase
MCADTTIHDTETPDYKDTLFLPRTDFPMRAGLPQREPDWLARWQRIGVYDRLRELPKAAGPSCCTTGRPMPTATCTSGTR